jgi:hypothetical protein
MPRVLRLALIVLAQPFKTGVELVAVPVTDPAMPLTP